MSSHHIVREKQEPALLVLGLGDFSLEHLGQLLEWSPTVIATPDSFEELNSNGIKIDWLVTENEHEAIQNDVRIISSPTSNYFSDALAELVNKGYTAVNIITDELDMAMLKDYVSRINMVIYSGDEKIFPIRPGYQKWMPAGETISIRSSGSEPVTLGLERLSDTEYKTIADGIISISFQEEYLFIAEKL